MERPSLETVLAFAVASRLLVAAWRHATADSRTRRTLARGRQIVALRLLRVPTPEIERLVRAMNEDAPGTPGPGRSL